MRISSKTPELTEPETPGWWGMRFRFPFRTLLVMSALSYVLVDYPPLRLKFAGSKAEVKRAEFYPLSSFPMYSTFSDSPFHVYVTDAAGDPVALETTFQTHASELKKTYEMKLKAKKKLAELDGRLTDVPQELKEQAGRETLELLKARPVVAAWLATRTDPLLRLHEVVLTAGDDDVHRAGTVVGEL